MRYHVFERVLDLGIGDIPDTVHPSFATKAGAKKFIEKHAKATNSSVTFYYVIPRSAKLNYDDL